MSLTERWKKFLSDIPPRAEFIHPSEFNTLIDRLVIETSKLTRRTDLNEMSDVEILAELRRLNLDNLANTNRLRSRYAELFSRYQHISDARKQEDWAHAWENFRLFVFRVFTAIGVAAVVLATYYVGWKVGIPMPLRMPV